MTRSVQSAISNRKATVLYTIDRAHHRESARHCPLGGGMHRNIRLRRAINSKKKQNWTGLQIPNSSAAAHSTFGCLFGDVTPLLFSPSSHSHCQSSASVD